MAEIYDSYFDKITPGKKTYDDYFDQPIKHKSPISTMFHRNTSNIVGINTSYGKSKYDNTLNWGADVNEDVEGSLNEHRAQEQSGWGQVGLGLARTTTKAATELAKTVAYLGGATAGIVGNTVDLFTGKDETDFLDTTFNNFAVNGLNKLNEHVNAEYLPVYTSKAVQDGDLIDKMKSTAFWATNGADGFGYMLSAMAPGAGFKALGLSEELLGLSAKALTRVGYAEDLGSTISKLTKLGFTAEKVNEIGITSANVFFEAGAESKGVSDDMYKEHDSTIKRIKQQPDYREKVLKHLGELDVQRRNGSISLDEYNQKSATAQDDVAENEFKERVGNAMMTSFWDNVAVLAGPDYIQTKLLYGKGAKSLIKTAENRAGRDIVDKLGQKVGPKLVGLENKTLSSLGNKIASKAAPEIVALEKVAQRSGKDVVKDVLKHFAKNAVSEGLWEEGIQTTLENRIVSRGLYGKKDANNLISDDHKINIDLISLGSDYIKTLGTTEGQVSVMLGAIQGGLFGVYGGMSQDKNDRERTNKLIDKINLHSSNYNTILNTDIYKSHVEKNKETGRQIRVFDKDENGNKILIPENVKKVHDALNIMEGKSQLFEDALKYGDDSVIEHLKQSAETELINNFIGEDEMGIDALHEHLKQLFPQNENASDNTLEEKERKNKNKENRENVDNLIKKAKYLQSQVQSFHDFQKALRIQPKHELATENDYKEYYNNLLNTFIGQKSEEYHEREKLNKLEQQKHDFEKNLDHLPEKKLELNPDYVEGKTEEIYKYKQPEQGNILKNLNQQIDKSKENLKEISEIVNDVIWDKKTNQNYFNSLIDQRNKLAKETSDEKVQETDDIINDIKSATTTEDLDKIKPNEHTAEQFNEKREELENHKTGERENEVAEKTPSTEVRQVLKSERKELTDDMTGELYSTFEGQPIEFINKDANGNLLYQTQSDGQVLFVDKITKQEETTVDDIVVGSANDFKVVDPKPVVNVDEDGNPSNDGKSPGIIKNNKQYADYLLESRDKKGDTVTFSVNRNAGKTYDSFYNTYDKFLKTGVLSDTDRQTLIDNLPITFHYNNGSSSFSSHGKILNKQLRTSIINHLEEGITLENLQSVVTNQANADFNNQIVDNKPAINNVLDVAEFNRDTKNLVLYHINTDGKFIVVSEKQEDFQGSHKVNQDLSGNIFVVMSHPKGYKIPAKLNSNKLNITQAEGLALLFKELTKSENTEQRDQVLANLESFNKIKDLLSKEIQLLGGTSNKISIDEMIKLLVLENSSKDSNKSIEIGIDDNGNQTVKFNNSEYNLENGIEDFVKDLTENKKQNVITIETDVTKVGDKNINFKNQAYLEYLFNNKIVSTDINTNPEEGSFKTASSATEQGSEVYIRSAVESNKQTTNAVFSGEQSFADKIQGKPDLTGVETSSQFEIETKKADIEKRRQEELKNRVVHGRKPTSEDGEFFIIGDGGKIRYKISDNTGRLQFLHENLWSNVGKGGGEFITLSTAEKEGFEKAKDKINAKYDAELVALKNNSENTRNVENNSVSLPNNVKIENEMDVPNTQANVDYKEAIDKIISDNKMTVDLQKNIDILAKNIEMRDSEDFKTKSEKVQNKILENIKKANVEMPQLIKNCG